MTTRHWTLTILTSLVAVSAAWGAARLFGLEKENPFREAELSAAREFSDREEEIAIFQKRAAEDPIGASDRAELAARYLQRSRETGGFNDVLRAETLARESLSLRVSGNLGAVVTLIAALLEQHRFTEARVLAHDLVLEEPAEDRYRAMLGEIDLELGNYAAADSAFKSLNAASLGTLGIAPSFARWLEINGETQASRRVLYRAAAKADSARHLMRETKAWFHFRIADMELRHGRLRGGERELLRARSLLPKDHRFMTAAARLASLRHDWRAAVAVGDSAIDLVLDPATIGMVGDAYAALGDTAKASEYNKTMEVAVVQQPGGYHRAWSLFLLDHDRRIPEVLGKIEKELETRPDIYGYDLLGWALYKSGRYLQAREALAKARSRGTEDALVFYHAGMVERAAGNIPAARQYLEKALELNPVFDPVHPKMARATLDSLH